jgi:hypothetical protein
VLGTLCLERALVTVIGHSCDLKNSGNEEEENDLKKERNL